jgi:hypothetical protein
MSVRTTVDELDEQVRQLVELEQDISASVHRGEEQRRHDVNLLLHGASMDLRRAMLQLKEARSLMKESKP